jgi:hypothetical protein
MLGCGSRGRRVWTLSAGILGALRPGVGFEAFFGFEHLKAFLFLGSLGRWSQPDSGLRPSLVGF